LQKICELGDRCAGARPDIHHDYDVHTALKLAALNHALDVFTPIAYQRANRRPEHRRSIYVDLFAGCGATKTREGDWLAGSPIIAANSRAPFDEMILVEKSRVRLDALQQRLIATAVKDRVVPKCLLGDSNEQVAEVIRQIRPDDLAFVTVDPEGMEPNWTTVEALVSACPASDLFLVLTAGAERVAGNAAKGGGGEESLSRFTGRNPEEILATMGRMTVLDQYVREVEEELGKPLGVSPTIFTKDGRPVYRVLIATRRTPRNSPYFRGYQDLNRRLSGVTATMASQAIDIIKGRQSTVSDPSFSTGG
jgi:three-Cys-motif partner protein